MEPADAGAIALHQPGPVQREGAGADPDERHARRGRALEEAHGLGMQVLDLVDQPADDDEIVERVGSPSRSSGCTTMPELDAIGSIVGDSTRQAQRIGRERSPSSAASRSTSTKFAERAEREPPRQDETDVQLGHSLTSAASIQQN